MRVPAQLMRAMAAEAEAAREARAKVTNIVVSCRDQCYAMVTMGVLSTYEIFGRLELR